MNGNSKSEAAQEIERRYRYRTLILRRKLRLPREAATKMVGPDCAFHLYGQHEGKAPQKDQKGSRGKT